MKKRTLHLFLLLAVATNSHAESRLVRLTALTDGANYRKEFKVLADQQLKLECLLVSQTQPRFRVRCRYEDTHVEVAITQGQAVSGPCVLTLENLDDNGGAVVAECVLNFSVNQTNPAASEKTVEIQRTVDLKNWKTLDQIADPSTNAFYRFRFSEPSKHP